MNNNIVRPKKVTSTELAKLLTAQRVEIYELTPTNAVPTVAKVSARKRPRQRHYLLSVVD
jgi:hypothetical protein